MFEDVVQETWRPAAVCVPKARLGSQCMSDDRRTARYALHRGDAASIFEFLRDQQSLVGMFAVSQYEYALTR